MGSRYDKEEIKFRAELHRIEQEGERELRKQQLKEKRNSYKPKRKKPNFSKIIIILLVLIVFEIIVWAEYEMHRLDDLSPAYALIGIVASLAPIVWRYFAKSEAENTIGGIVYDTAIKPDDDEESVG